MARKVMLFMTLIGLCLLCGCASGNEKTISAPEVTGNFEFVLLKTGQADAIFMQTQNANILLDCGETDDGDKIVELLQAKGVSDIDYLFITHFDKDHVGGLPEVAEHVNIKSVVVPDYIGNNEEYAAYIKATKQHNLSVTALKEDVVFNIDDVLFEISVPKKQFYPEGDNDFSLVLSVTHGENTFLFPGDAEKGRLPEVLSEFSRQYDFLKIPHHGKSNKFTQRFINTVKPVYAVVTDSEKHPASEKTMSLFSSVGTKVYSTKDGDVFVQSDGKEMKISQ